MTVSSSATGSQLAGSTGPALTAATHARAFSQALVHGWGTGFELAAAFGFAALLSATFVLRSRRREPLVEEDVQIDPAEQEVVRS